MFRNKSIFKLLARSFEMLLSKLCFNTKNYAYSRNKTQSTNTLKIKDDMNNFELLDSFNNSSLTFRELPVDCPSSKEIFQPLVNLKSENQQCISFLIENDLNVSCLDESNDQLIKEMLARTPTLLNCPNRRTFVKSSSLSTIAEEKTMNTQNISLNSSNVQNINERFMIQKLLDEFHDKNTLINEIMHVFEPSSKYGYFKRNVPIRFSSPIKNKFDLSNTSLDSYSTGSTNLLSPQSLKSNLLAKDMCINSGEKNPNWISTQIGLAAKKMRLVKRLKNRIETRTGQKLINKSLNRSANLSAVDSRKKKKQVIQLKAHSPFRQRNTLSLSSKRHLSFEIKQNVDIFNSNTRLFNNQSVTVLTKTDVEPVYF
jgi:hypothetical protein